MIRKKASEIYDKLIKNEIPISNMDMYDIDIIKIIEIIANECKSSIKDEEGNVKKYESVLDINSVRNLIIQFLRNNQVINNTAVKDVMEINYEPEIYQPQALLENKILGPTFNAFLEMKISQDGKNIEEVEIQGPISENLDECLLGKDESQSDRIRKLVLDPFVENMINDNKYLRKKYPIASIFNRLTKRRKDTNQIIEDYIKILSENLNPTVAKNTAIYIVQNLLMNKSFFKDLEEKTKIGKLSINLNDNSKGYLGFKNQIITEILECIKSPTINPSKGLETIKQIYSDIIAQLKVMKTSIDKKDAKEIQQVLKDINQTILSGSKDYDENGYRNIEVGMRNSGKMINVVPKIHVEQAMEHLTQLIVTTMANRQNLTKEEYIRQVSKIHYRFIRIHPFPDGNGRTGRALINMMLEPIGEAIIFDKENKDKYMKALNFEHYNIDDVNKEKYLENLYKNPEDCNRFEENFEYLLEECIGEKLQIEYLDRDITEIIGREDCK